MRRQTRLGLRRFIATLGVDEQPAQASTWPEGTKDESANSLVSWFIWIVEGIGFIQLASVDQAHEAIAHFRAVQGAIEQRILTMQHGAFQGAFADVMPTPGLCRAVRLSDFPAGFPIVADAA